MVEVIVQWNWDNIFSLKLKAGLLDFYFINPQQVSKKLSIQVLVETEIISVYNKGIFFLFISHENILQTSNDQCLRLFVYS